MLFGSLFQRMRAVWGNSDSALPSVSPQFTDYLQSAAEQHLAELRSDASKAAPCQGMAKSDDSSSPTSSVSVSVSVMETPNHKEAQTPVEKSKRRCSSDPPRKRPKIQPDIPTPHPERDLFYIVHFTSCRIGNHLECPLPPDRSKGLKTLELNQDDSEALAKYRDVRGRLAAGFFLSTMATIHKELQRNYGKANTNLSRKKSSDEPNQHTLILRTKLASLWIMYAHTILEVGLELCQQQQELKRQQTNIHTAKRHMPSSFQNLTSEDEHALVPELTVQAVLNHAFAILQAARECPLVGNHKYITLSLGRLLVVGRVLETDDNYTQITKVASQALRVAITDAITTCHNSMEICHGILPSKQRRIQRTSAEICIQNLCKYFPNPPRSTNSPRNTKVFGVGLGEDLRAVLELPGRLRDSAKLSAAVTKDLNSARAICNEVNRWCRLREKIGKRLYTLLFLSPEDGAKDGRTTVATPLFEYFLFFRTMDCASDVPPEGAKWTDLEHAPPDDGGGCVEWTW